MGAGGHALTHRQADATALRLINYVVDSYARAAASDMVLMPVSIAYDQVPEVGAYIAEQKGISKRPESASWFLQYVSGLRNPFGRIHVRFGEGLKLSEVLGEPRRDRFGQTTATAERVERCDWKGHAILLATVPEEYVGVRVVPVRKKRLLYQCV